MQIFTERPEVHKAFLTHVPHTVDEKEFWTRFFKREFKREAKRRKMAASGKLAVEGVQVEEDEIFSPLERQMNEQVGREGFVG